MLPGPGLQKNVGNDSLLIDEKSGPEQSHIISPEQLFFPPDAVAVDNLMIRIGNQRKGQTEFFFKPEVAFFTIRANTQHNKSFFSEHPIIVPQITSLLCTRRRVILRIEIEHNFLPFIIFQGNLPSLLVDAAECGCLVTLPEMSHTISFTMTVCQGPLAKKNPGPFRQSDYRVN